MKREGGSMAKGRGFLGRVLSDPDQVLAHVAAIEHDTSGDYRSTNNFPCTVITLHNGKVRHKRMPESKFRWIREILKLKNSFKSTN